MPDMSEVRPVKVARMLQEIADHYVSMSLMVHPTARTAADDTGVRVKQSESLPVPADLYVIHRMRQMEHWTRGLLHRVLSADQAAGKLKHTDVSGSVSVPAVLRAIARNRIGLFVPPADAVVAFAFELDVRHWHKFASETVEPTRRRWRDMKVQCVEVIDDGEELVECTGVYGMWVNPHYAEAAPDLQCSEDDTHVVSPVRWQRAGRRSGYNPDDIRARLKRERVNS